MSKGSPLPWRVSVCVCVCGGDDDTVNIARSALTKLLRVEIQLHVWCELISKLLLCICLKTRSLLHYRFIKPLVPIIDCF